MAKSLEGNPVKAAHAKIEYNEKMLEELAKCSDPSNGYMYFITEYGHIKHPERGMILYKPFEYQYDLLHVYHNYRFSISMVGRQMGKALAYDTPILTSIGYKTMEDVMVGHFVYDENGLAIEVVDKTDVQIGRVCYKVEFSNGDFIVADSEHLWVIDGYPEPIKTIDLVEGHGITKPVKLGSMRKEVVRVASIDLVDSVPVYCISVDNINHTFLAGDSLIPTHNCVTDKTKIVVRDKDSLTERAVSIKDFHEDNI